MIARTGVELYCEEVAFAKVNDAIIGSVIEPKPPVDQDGGGKRNLLLGDTFQFGPGVVRPTDPAQAEVIARRLLATIQPEVADPSVTRRDDGIALGKHWATENATLEELRQVSALESGEWTAMKLDSEHSLIAQLRDAGVVPPGGDGPVDLDRDDFVQGIVTGASEVLRSATPHLTK